MKRLCFFAVICIATLQSCKNDKFKPKPQPDPVNTPSTPANTGCGVLANVSFSSQVQPILNPKCGAVNGCHDVSSNYKLYDYAHVVLFANSGQLVGCLTGDPSYSQMAGNGGLDSCAIKTILHWVQQGKLNN